MKLIMNNAIQLPNIDNRKRQPCVRILNFFGLLVLYSALLLKVDGFTSSSSTRSSTSRTRWSRIGFVDKEICDLNQLESSETSQQFEIDDSIDSDHVHHANHFTRRNLIGMVGAASVLVFYDGVSATDLTNRQKETEIGESAGSSLSTTYLSSSSELSSSPTIDTQAILNKAAKKALGGGKAGAAAAFIQIFSLMWLRTAMNYQYRFGGTLSSSLNDLYAEGGIPRLYQGLPFALVQGPLTRFGDTAANVGILALLESIPQTASLPLPLKTASGSVCAGLWRIILMPIDTSKTAMQVEGAEGLARLKDRVMESGPGPLYQGSVASAAATAAGHFPWFLTYNFCNDRFPVISKEEDLLLFLVRSAALGLAASCVSDCFSNSLRVLKVYKQSSPDELSYTQVVQNVIQESGLTGLFVRGLKTRLLTNALQGSVFSVLLKYFQATT